MRESLLITVVVFVASFISLREVSASEPLYWAPFLLCYGALAAFALYRFKVAGILAERCAPRRGDITIGVLLSVLLLGAAWLIKQQLIPDGSERNAWLFQIYLLVGPIAGNAPRMLLLIALAVSQELVWRGYVTLRLKETLGARRALPLAVALNGLAHSPTLFTLGDTGAGHNPLFVLATLGSALVWSFVALQTGRVFPLMISHAVFAYFAASPLAFSGMF